MRQGIHCSQLLKIIDVMEVAMRVNFPTLEQFGIRMNPPLPLPSSPQNLRLVLKPLCCITTSQEQTELGIICEPCNDKGWLVCDFCNGQKTNVKAKNKRVYRRCPSCRGVGYVLCTSCKMFKCITFPSFEDGAELSR